MEAACVGFVGSSSSKPYITTVTNTHMNSYAVQSTQCHAHIDLTPRHIHVLTVTIGWPPRTMRLRRANTLDGDGSSRKSYGHACVVYACNTPTYPIKRRQP